VLHYVDVVEPAATSFKRTEAAMTTFDYRPSSLDLVVTDQGEHTLQRLLASAYAERLSCLRCDASDGELAENASLIADLEARYREARAPAAPLVVLRDPADFLG